MADFSRRDFLRHASVGAAVTGVLAATGTALWSSVDASATSLPAETGPEVPLSANGDIFAHVADLSTGKITIFHGTRAYTIVDPSLARSLARVTQ